MDTYRIFPSRIGAERYAIACHLRILRRRAAQGDGTLRNIVTALRERVVDEWPDDHEALRTWLATLTAKQLTDLRTRIARLPLMGRDHRGALVEDRGHTTAWDAPRQTKDGRWAVQCPPFDTTGGAAPVWPDPVLTP